MIIALPCSLSYLTPEAWRLTVQSQENYELENHGGVEKGGGVLFKQRKDGVGRKI